MNIDINVCPQCGIGARRVPGGKSQRTGRTYNSFFTCDHGCVTRWKGRLKPLTWQHAGHWANLHHVDTFAGRPTVVDSPSQPPPAKELPPPIQLPWDRLDEIGRVRQEDPA